MIRPFSIYFGILFILLRVDINAQDGQKFKTQIGVQLWSTYTYGQEYFDSESSSYIPLTNRWNNQIRRTRIGVSGTPLPNLKYKLTVSLDLVGRDVNAATQGGSNNTNFGQFGLWNMYLLWQPFATTDLFHIKVGFQPIQIGRASITAALRSTSFEKSWSQNYLRRHIMGRGPGRVMGVNIGGQKVVSPSLAFSYDTGIFTPQAFSSVNNSQGKTASPLWVGRLVMHMGDPESKQYSTGHKINYFGKRNGLSVAVASSYQGQTDLFSSNSTFGFDWLLNFGMLNLDGEWTYLSRSKDELQASSVASYIRVGYNIPVEGRGFLEPVFMLTRFNGAMDLEEQIEANSLKSFAGSDQVMDLSLNYHINTNTKVTLNYTMNRGRKGAFSDGATFNNYFRNSEKDPIRRGNMLGLAFVTIF